MVTCNKLAMYTCAGWKLQQQLQGGLVFVHGWQTAKEIYKHAAAAVSANDMFLGLVLRQPTDTHPTTPRLPMVDRCFARLCQFVPDSHP